MKFKRGFFVFVLIVFGISFFSGVVSAYSGPIEGLKDISYEVYEIIRPLLELAVGKDMGGQDLDADTFFAKILFLFIIFSFVYVVLKKVNFFSENTWALWIVSVAFSVLTIRWMGGSEIIKGILLPYNTFGIAVSAGLPFLLFFFIVNDYPTSIRKVSWLFFSVIFIGLWFTRYGDGELGVGIWAYPITALAGGIMFLMDGTIHKIKLKINEEKHKDISNSKKRIKIRQTRQDLEDSRIAGTVTEEEYKKIDKNLKIIEKKYGLI